MSITDELRMYVQDWRDTPSLMDGLDMGDVDGILEDFIRIADSIDAEHEHMYEALTIGMEPMTEENMARDGWVKLPVDADCVPIHVGDELDGLHYEDGMVTGIQYGTDGRTMIAVRPNGWDTPTWRDPEEYRHHIADSWERIIGDAANLVRGDNESVVELVERCRRLAGEA